VRVVVVVVVVITEKQIQPRN